MDGVLSFHSVTNLSSNRTKHGFLTGSAKVHNLGYVYYCHIKCCLNFVFQMHINEGKKCYCGSKVRSYF